MSVIEKTETDVTTKSDSEISLPKLYKVLLHNDDYTTMDFVIFVLETVFHKSYEEAKQLMLKVHNEGLAVCGIYSFEIAETKSAQVKTLAKEHGHPLKCTIEAE